MLTLPTGPIVPRVSQVRDTSEAGHLFLLVSSMGQVPPFPTLMEHCDVACDKRQGSFPTLFPTLSVRHPEVVRDRYPLCSHVGVLPLALTR
jgi:hypothetical protein